jgi:hypothetical protein
MTSEFSLAKPKMARGRVLLEEMRVHGWTWQSAGAACGLWGGIISPIGGSILTAISWFTGPVWHGLAVQRDGTVLLFLTIPLLIFGAHCLDLVDKQSEKAKKSQ